MPAFPKDLEKVAVTFFTVRLTRTQEAPMRILEEAVFRFFDQKTRSSPAEEQRTEPVDKPPASGDALARPRAKQQRQRSQERERSEHQQSDAEKERRGQDRRQNQQVVFLDTRTTPSRRRSGRPPEIDTQV